MTFRLLITGGAGFVGSSLALAFRRDHPDWKVVAFDNLKRRGSELAISRLRAAGVEFHHGDVRCADDLEALGPVDLLIECSAEPSVHAGYQDAPNYVISTNLGGTVNCLEHLRRHGGDLLFLSTSRVYPIGGLRELPFEQQGDRLALPSGSAGEGWSGDAGIGENFPINGGRSLYGATKLASELLIEEYRAMYGLRAVVNRCGVLAGPWQMGKVDQGFVVLWMTRHIYGGTLAYTGFGGEGLQVRDLLHVDDLYDLLQLQLRALDHHSGATYNAGGGLPLSVSLRELTQWCERMTGNCLPIGRVPQTRPADIPYYVSDCRRVQQATGWRPQRGLAGLLEDIHRWLVDARAELEPILGS
jgi:CDP-paratose 2-epimerase